MQLRRFAVLLAFATAAPSGAGHSQTIAFGDGIVIPANSPVSLGATDEEMAQARFSGRFVLRGRYTYGCESDCDQPHADRLYLTIYPDADLAARLPRWRQYADVGIAITILNGDAFSRQALTRPQRAALLDGKLEHVSGRTSVIVDDLRLTIDCDSPSYSARFVAMAPPMNPTRQQVASSYGCGVPGPD